MSTEVRRIRLRAGLRELTPGGEIEPLFEEYVLGEDYDAAQKRIAELEGDLAASQSRAEYVENKYGLLLADLGIARPCVRNEFNRCEMLILQVEKSNAGPPVLPKHYLGVMNEEANRLRAWLDRYDALSPPKDVP